MKTIIILPAFLVFSVFASEINFHSINGIGKTQFEAIGKPAMIKIKGESAVPQTILILSAGKAKLEAELALDELSTGIDLRDEHMKEKYLETKKYPKAKLVIPDLKLPLDWEKNPISQANQNFQGSLTLHGKIMPIEGTFTLNDKREVKAEFEIKLTDYGIEIPDYLGVKVAEVVKIKTQIQFEKK